IQLLKNVVGVTPVKTFTNKRIPTWGIRPGLPIGCKITLRKGKAKEVLARLLLAKDNKVKPKQFDGSGNLSFGIHEYIDVPDVKYDPKIGIMGFEVCVTLERPGHRIKRRSINKKKVPKKQDITQEEAIEFFKKEFNVKVGE
ncbi:MAG: 50S ribosomal protein L5, partial [Nanoarchaeota archaeon]|nr:50S ribosomal protein L5 [Nanoarchaeota archaeon]